MRLKILNAEVYDPTPCGQQTILIEDQRILEVEAQYGDADASETLDARGLIAVPGLIDLHLHGGGGRCCMEGTAQSVLTMCNTHAQFGSTTVLPTTWTAPMEQINKAIDAVREASGMPCDATIAGVHLEGPFLSPLQAGAQAAAALKVPKQTNWRELLDRWDGIRMVGAAPELDGALELGGELQKRGIVASIAHSQAYEPELRSAVEHGFCDVTHLYSGCSTFIRKGGFRIPGVVECGLAFDELTVQVIADGRHLPPTMLKMIWKAKGTNGIELITDALDYAGCRLQEGSTYTQQNGMEVIYEEGVMKLLSREAFAGSVATTDRLLRTAVAAGIPFEDALRMLTVNPAKRIGLEKNKGCLKPGYDADIVFFDDELQVKGCLSRGRLIRWDRERNE